MNKVLGLFLFLLASISLIGQTNMLGEDYVVVVRLATKQNTVDFLNKKLQDTSLKENLRQRYTAELAAIEKAKSAQFTDICSSLEAYFSTSVYYILDSDMKSWDRENAPEVYIGNPLESAEKIKLDKPFLLVASGDFTTTRLTEKAFVILDKELSRAPSPFGMRKSIKARGESFMTFRSTDKQWDRIAEYLFRHLSSTIALNSLKSELFREEFKASLLFNR